MTPKALVDAIERRVGVSGPPRQVRDAIESELLQSGTDLATAAEQIDVLRKRVVVEINKRRNESEELGEIAVLHVLDEQEEVVFGSCHTFATDSAELKQAKLNRVSAGAIYAHVRSLTFSKFEQLGRSTLRELGCKAPRLTPHAGDQGIDFYGEISFGDVLGAMPGFLKLFHETRITLIGQAKHFPNTPIGPSIVRELVGALSLARTRTYSNDDIDLLDDIRLRPFSPVLALLFSTGSFTRGAKHLANRAGLIVFSGWQLAVFLADRGVGLVDSAFNAAAFEKWLAEESV